MNANVIWTATYEWLEIATRQGLNIDWGAEPVSADNWDDACRLCGFGANDEEVGFAVLDDPRPQDTLLRQGDLVATSGYGGDVVFLRRHIPKAHASDPHGREVVTDRTRSSGLRGIFVF